MALTRFQSKVKISFSLDFQGRINSLAFPIEPTLPDQLYKRKSLTIDTRTQANLIGYFDYPVKGQSVSVSIDKENLQLTLTGQASQTLQCVDQTPELLRFKIGGGDRSIVEFFCGDEGWHRLLIKLPDASYDCPRLKSVNPTERNV